VTPEIKAKALELSQEAKTDHEKVLSIYNYVTTLRYVAIPLGVNSFRPHAAAMFSKSVRRLQRQGQSFNAMLHSLNIDANLVLVPRFRQAYDAAARPGFQSRYLSRDFARWNALGGYHGRPLQVWDVAAGDSGRKVLVIASGTNSLMQLPTPEPNRHKLTIHGQVDCSHGNDPVAARFDVVASGYPDYEMRESARQGRDRAGSLPLLSARYRLSAGSLALEKQTATAVAALDKNFSWRAEGGCIGICRPIHTKDNTPTIQQSICAPFWFPKEWDLALHPPSLTSFPQ